MAVSALQFFSSDYRPKKISYTEFLEFINNEMVESGSIVGRKFKGKLKEPLLFKTNDIDYLKKNLYQ